MAKKYQQLEEKHNKLVLELERKNKLVDELRSKIECPVCLIIPTEGPMASCPKGHLVCVPYHQTMVAGGQLNCPNCRALMGNTMSLLAKTVIENIEHKCMNEGCNEKLPQKEVGKHVEEICKHRRVLCPGSSFCKAVLPFSELKDHVKICTAFKANKLVSAVNIFRIDKHILNRGDQSFKSRLLQMNNEEFALQQKISNSNISFSVLMLADRYKCDRFKMTIEIQDENSKAAFLAQFNPAPVDMERFDQPFFMVHTKRFEKMVTSDGEKSRFKLDIKVSEKRASED